MAIDDALDKAQKALALLREIEQDRVVGVLGFEGAALLVDARASTQGLVAIVQRVDDAATAAIRSLKEVE